MPVGTGTGKKIGQIQTGLIPHPHPASGEPVMGEMQGRKQSRLIAGVQRCHEAVEHCERRAYRSLVGVGLRPVERHLEQTVPA
ncbi:MAG: hypothetical protein JO358_05370 [Alphaproteobacteria bacterium]|nr:hypothetical protein [Alphaproteobacteria bacterium]